MGTYASMARHGNGIKKGLEMLGNLQKELLLVNVEGTSGLRYDHRLLEAIENVRVG